MTDDPDEVPAQPVAPRTMPSDHDGRERMIGRIWHGWTTAENADAYEALLRGEVLSRWDERSQHYEIRERVAYG